MLLRSLAFNFVFFAVSCVSNSAGSLINITIDDTYGDPVTLAHFDYTPSNVWNIGQDCDNCTAPVDPSVTWLGSWHDGTFDPLSNSYDSDTVLTASVSFNGSALYVFCILTPTTSSAPDGNTDMTFMIDDQVVGTFISTENSNVDYTVPVYVNRTIPVGVHNFTLINGHVNGTKSLTLLDYIIYSTEEDKSHPLPIASLTDPLIDLPTPSFDPSETLDLHSTSSAASVKTSTVSSSTTFATVSPSKLNEAIVIPISIIAILFVVVSIGILLRRRRQCPSRFTVPARNTFASRSRLSRHPSASGWVEGTWDDDEDRPRLSLLSSSFHRSRSPSLSSAATDVVRVTSPVIHISSSPLVPNHTSIARPSLSDSIDLSESDTRNENIKAETKEVTFTAPEEDIRLPSPVQVLNTHSTRVLPALYAETQFDTKARAALRLRMAREYIMRMNAHLQVPDESSSNTSAGSITVRSPIERGCPTIAVHRRKASASFREGINGEKPLPVLPLRSTKCDEFSLGL